jgi:hypothetical protein
MDSNAAASAGGASEPAESNAGALAFARLAAAAQAVHAWMPEGMARAAQGRSPGFAHQRYSAYLSQTRRRNG